MTRTIGRWLLALALGAIGVLHFIQTRGFRVVVPDWASRITRMDKDAIVIASGAAEVSLAAGLLTLPRERRRIGWATAAFFVAVFPGNVAQWMHHRDGFGLDTDMKRFVRLFFQPVLVALALWSTREPRR